jgi:hypothetical protein
MTLEVGHNSGSYELTELRHVCVFWIHQLGMVLVIGTIRKKTICSGKPRQLAFC